MDLDKENLEIGDGVIDIDGNIRVVMFYHDNTRPTHKNLFNCHLCAKKFRVFTTIEQHLLNQHKVIVILKDADNKAHIKLPQSHVLNKTSTTVIKSEPKTSPELPDESITTEPTPSSTRKRRQSTVFGGTKKKGRRGQYKRTVSIKPELEDNHKSPSVSVIPFGKVTIKQELEEEENQMEIGTSSSSQRIMSPQPIAPMLDSTLQYNYSANVKMERYEIEDEDLSEFFDLYLDEPTQKMESLAPPEESFVGAMNIPSPTYETDQIELQTGTNAPADFAALAAEFDQTLESVLSGGVEIERLEFDKIANTEPGDASGTQCSSNSLQSASSASIDFNSLPTSQPSGTKSSYDDDELLPLPLTNSRLVEEMIRFNSEELMDDILECFQEEEEVQDTISL